MTMHKPGDIEATAVGRPVTRDHLPALDGLRSIAIILVLLYHLTPGHNSHQGLAGSVFKIADIGWSGVDLFFVLSGFLITGILLRGKSSGLSAGEFVLRRVMRILPAHYVALFAMFVAAPLLLGWERMPSLAQQAPFWLYYNNFHFASEGPGNIFAVGHFWSLAMEMQCYLLWPFIVQKFPSAKLLRIGFGALLVIFLMRCVAVAADVHWNVLFGWTPMRMSGLIIGSLVAVALDGGGSFERTRGLKALTLGTILVCLAYAGAVAWFGKGAVIFTTGRTALELVLRATLPVVMSLLFGAVLLLSLQKTKWLRPLELPPFRLLARYSYGIYIYHFILTPVFDRYFAPPILARYTGGADSSVYLYLLLASLVSLVLAVVSYHAVEVHFLRWKPGFSRSPGALTPARLPK